MGATPWRFKSSPRHHFFAVIARPCNGRGDLRTACFSRKARAYRNSGTLLQGEELGKRERASIEHCPPLAAASIKHCLPLAAASIKHCPPLAILRSPDSRRALRASNPACHEIASLGCAPPRNDTLDAFNASSVSAHGRTSSRTAGRLSCRTVAGRPIRHPPRAAHRTCRDGTDGP